MKKKLISTILILSLILGILPVASFADEPLATARYTVLVLDTSGSMKGAPMEALKGAAKKFVEQVMAARGQNYVGIVKYSDYGQNVAQFTQDQDVLYSAIDNLYAGGGTNTTDGLLAAKQLFENTTLPDNVKKNIVLMTDGLPENGDTLEFGHYTVLDYEGYQYANATYDLASNLHSEYYITTVGLFHSIKYKPLVVAFAKKFLSDLANGGFYNVTDIDELKFTFVKLADDIQKNQENCPIIIVPGIMGSNLYYGDFRIWPPYHPSEEPAITALDFELKFRFNSRPAYSKLIDISTYLEGRGMENDQSELLVHNSYENTYGVQHNLREYGAKNSYKKLVDYICDEFGSTREVYFFSYDFRQSNAVSAAMLESFIDEIKPDGGKVDLVGHSMGGLVISNYYSKFGDRNKINNIITIATPYEGSPELALRVASGRVLGDKKIEDSLGSSYLSLIKGVSGDILKKFRSVSELLPTKDYFNFVQKNLGFPFKVKYYKVVHTSGSRQVARPYTKKMELADYYKTINKLIPNYRLGMGALNSLKTSNGMNLLAGYDKSYYIVGVGQPTNHGITASSFGGVSNEYLTMADGDGTVPYESATMNRALDNNPKFDGRVFKINDNHTDIVKNDKTLLILKNILSGVPVNVKQDIAEKRKYMVIRIACPVDVEIARNGELLSSQPDNFNAQTSFGRIDFYGDNLDTKIVVLDYDAAQQVQLNGYDKGAMDYSISWYDENNQLMDHREFINAPITQNTVMTSNTNIAESTVLTIDDDGDGATDKTYSTSDDDKYILINNQHEISFFDWDNKVLDVQTVTHGAIAIAPQEPQRQGYAFTGWSYPVGPVYKNRIYYALYEQLAGNNQDIEYREEKEEPKWTKFKHVFENIAIIVDQDAMNIKVNKEDLSIVNVLDKAEALSSNNKIGRPKYAYDLTFGELFNGLEFEKNISIRFSLKDIDNPDDYYIVYFDNNDNAVVLNSIIINNEMSAKLPGSGVVALCNKQQVMDHFKDIGNHWAQKAIDYLAKMNAFGESVDNLYRPENAITRADFIYYVMNVLALDKKSSTAFDDVSPSSKYYDVLQTARAMGIIKGIGNNMFDPNKPISRQDLMVILSRAINVANLKEKLNIEEVLTDEYKDYQTISDYALEDVKFMLDTKIIHGTPQKMINPFANTSRAEAAQIIYNLLMAVK